MIKPPKPQRSTSREGAERLSPPPADQPRKRSSTVNSGSGRSTRSDAARDPKDTRPTGDETARVALPPGARISRRAADRLRAGHVWVYASDIESVEVDPDQAPELLPVADSRGLLLGTALYSPTSQIALRLVSREALDEAKWLALLERRLHMAIERRIPRLKQAAERLDISGEFAAGPLSGAKARADYVGSMRGLKPPPPSEPGSSGASKADSTETDSCRLCFSEADEIPGLIIDKYGPLMVVQRLARGLHTAGVREVCVRVLRELLSPTTILERPDPRIRELEGLDAPELAPLWAANPAEPVTSTQFHLNGLVFHFDANAGQKTGAFLDQSANYAAAQQYAWQLTSGGRALDVCCYQGGFALHLARVCRRVTGIDASRASLEVAERNMDANQAQLSGEVDWVEGDAFQILRDWAGAREQFDTIVLDPPAFAKSKRAVEGALRGYKELNLRALQMMRPGGLLVTCSCSHHVAWADLEGAVASAAADAHRRVRLLERRGAAPDHPVVLNLPETEYLKCLVLEVE
jgi:23S rRNA (cytosine1962-C5)-methyltransferase